MTEEIKINKAADKQQIYELLLPQILHLIEGEEDLVANLANITAVLREAFGFLWTGFYFVKGNQLVLGPFQGPVACTRIDFGKGVCGTAWKEKRTIVVDNVNDFPGHIACSSHSRSEIVVPVIEAGEVTMVLDIDSDKIGAFDATDKNYLTQLIELIQNKTNQ